MFRPLFIASLLVTGVACLAQNPEPYPKPPSKKGLQVQLVDDALALGIHHAGLNCHLAALMDLQPRPDSIAFQSEGETYYFRASRVAALDAQVQPLSARGVVISLILLNYENKDEALNAIFLHPKYARGEKHNRVSAFNVITPDGLRYLRAVVGFLADRYSDPAAPHGRVWNYIVGNEVTSHWWWNNQGRATPEEVAADYEKTVRLVYDSVHARLAAARVYISMDHHWGMRYAAGTADQACSGRELVTAFAKAARAHGDFPWNIAYHPYPENLGEPRFWFDRTALQTVDTPRITFKNLEMLPRILQDPAFTYQGQPRRIILSEQGFHCPERPDGERDQAAAYCAAWVKVAGLETIDAFILHRHVDHRDEGINLGLWTRKPDSIANPDRHRAMYDCFKAADTPDWQKAFAFALPVVGIERWEDLDKR